MFVDVSLVDVPSYGVFDFFTKNDFHYDTREECLRFANLTFPEEMVQEADVQDHRSYSVAISSTHLLQFRPERSKLDVQIYDDARRVFGHLVADMTYLGPFGGIHSRRDLDPWFSPDNPPILHMYLIEKMQGQPLSSIFAQQNDMLSTTLEFRETLVQDLARIFATSYHHRVPPPEDLTCSKGGSSPPHGRIESSLHRRASLLTGLQDRHLSGEAKALKDYLRFIEHLPWCLTHGGLTPSNIMVDPQTGHITGLLDWAEGEWLPLGIGMYAIDEVLGRNDPKDGFVYFPEHAQLRMLFWKSFMRMCEGCCSPLYERRTLRQVELARRMGLLLWRGIALDYGNLGRLVQEGRDDGEWKKLRVLMTAPGVMDYLIWDEEMRLVEEVDNWWYWRRWFVCLRRGRR